MDGYAGKFLRVDLNNEELREEVFDEATLRSCVGGTGIGAKILYEEVPPGVEWSDSENRLILATGPLGGSSIPGSGSYSVVTKGPLTNGATASQANGFFGAYLRFCGYDGVIVQGAASRWLYLHIREDGAELRDASRLAGKDTWETSDLIKQELNRRESGISIACVGPAGENLVKLASLVTDKGHVAGHNGLGAVMGSKKLKAIAVDRNRGRPPFRDVRRLREIGNWFTDTKKGNPNRVQSFFWGTLEGVHRGGLAGTLPVKNYTTNKYPISPELLEKYSAGYIRANFEPRRNPCWGCQSHHCHMMRIPEGRYRGERVEEPEYEAMAAWGPVTGQTDVASTLVIANDVERWGMETNEMGWLMALVMECYEKGILTLEDTDGLEMTWGNAQATREMLRKIAFREGFGDVLAEGVMRAARLIGGEAPNMAVHTMKGNSPRGHDHRIAWLEMFDTGVSNTGTIESHRGQTPRELYGIPAQFNQFEPDAVVNFTVKAKPAMQFEDCLGVCRQCTFLLTSKEVEAIQAATRWEDFTFEEAKAVGLRIVNRLKAFNLRHGIGPELDRPSPRYGSTPVDGPAQGVSIMPHWDRMVHDYYEQMGWDRESGRPLPETLRDLGLDDVANDLWE